MTSRPALRRLWIEPPLAIARLGGSDTPLDAFDWGPNDNSAGGTGKTTISPAETLYFDALGGLTSATPDVVQFKDETGFRPVCPFFELHGEWESDGVVTSGPVTDQIVDSNQLEWTISVANLKPFNMTRDPAVRLTASITLDGDNTAETTLEGRCPAGDTPPLVPPDRSIAMGRVRLTRPNDRFPEYRLRFTPAKGYFYGPSNLRDRWTVELPPERLLLNPDSSWCKWHADWHDVRASPSGQYAQDDRGISYGMIDDTCDGIISCRLKGSALPPAGARIVVAPPDYAPDRRPVVSIADGLKDRTSDDDIPRPGSAGDQMLLRREALDLFERVFETVSLMNIDWIVDTFILLNEEDAQGGTEDYKPSDFFSRGVPSDGDPLPLSTRVVQRHRRLGTDEGLLNFLRRRPDLIETWVRDPATKRRLMTHEMPAGMLGGDGFPLHLTRRQVGLLRRFVETAVAHPLAPFPREE